RRGAGDPARRAGSDLREVLPRIGRRPGARGNGSRPRDRPGDPAVPWRPHRGRLFPVRRRPLYRRLSLARCRGGSHAMTVPTRPTRIRVVDDEEPIRRALNSILSARRYDVALAASGREALAAAIDHPPDLVVLDLSMPGMDGLEVCRQMRGWL